MTKRSDQAQVIDELQRQLRDLLCLAVVGDYVRRVLTGDETAELAEWLSHDEARRLLASRLGAVREWARYRRSQAASRDTVRLLDAVCWGLEEQAESLPVAGAS